MRRGDISSTSDLRKAFGVKHQDKEAMMFCRLHRRHAWVFLFAVLACYSTTTSAATKSQGDHSLLQVPAPAPADARVDIRTVEFDPALLPAATPTHIDHSLDPTSDHQATVIPLPPAAWTGMAGLLSLGLIRGRHKLRRFLS